MASRYELLLKSYVGKLSKLSNEHPDLADATEALRLIEEINVANNMKKREILVTLSKPGNLKFRQG